MNSIDKLTPPHVTSYLSTNEANIIEGKIDFEIAKFHYSMLKLGAIANVIGGAFFVLTLYGRVNSLLIFSWYSVLVLINLLNILWEERCKSPVMTLKKLRMWRVGFLYLFACISLVWSSIGIIFISGDMHSQLSSFVFLLAVLVCFSLSTVIDFTVSAISISFLLVPPVVYRVYLGTNNILSLGHDPDLNIGISASLFVCGIFLLVACYLGAKIVRKFFRLSFENLALNEKLENMNKFLEHRVQERTLELENSLKLVTYQSTHDLLTDLPNERLLVEYIQPAIKFAKQHNSMFAVVCFFPNEMERINDGLGHQAGDMAIQIVAQRLQEAFPHTTKPGVTHYTITLSRKDIFVILIEPLFSLKEVDLKVEELFKVLNEPLKIETHNIKLTTSIGVSLYPRDGNDIKTLLMNADVAMLKAKSKGGNSLTIYNPENHTNISMQLQMDSKLHEALTESEFLLQYQPLVMLSSGEIDGVEALVRWKNPLLGFIPPNNFIPLAEANGVIIPLGEWVFRTACEQAKIWHKLGYSKLKMSINLSAKQLHNKHIIRNIAAILTETDIDPCLVELELTESEAFHPEVIPILKLFKDMGLGLAIDDFGTGYSGLMGLKLLAIDKLKIDKTFIDDVVTNAECSAIVSNIIDLAKKMKIIVLAEGVETKEQLHFLRDHGCDMIQGYYFSRPIYPDDITVLLKNKTKIIF